MTDFKEKSKQEQELIEQAKRYWLQARRYDPTVSMDDIVMEMKAALAKEETNGGG